LGPSAHTWALVVSAQALYSCRVERPSSPPQPRGTGRGGGPEGSAGCRARSRRNVSIHVGVFRVQRHPHVGGSHDPRTQHPRRSRRTRGLGSSTSLGREVEALVDSSTRHDVPEARSGIDTRHELAAVSNVQKGLRTLARQRGGTRGCRGGAEWCGPNGLLPCIHAGSGPSLSTRCTGCYGATSESGTRRRLRAWPEVLLGGRASRSTNGSCDSAGCDSG
jgi:hypothetical protein